MSKADTRRRKAADIDKDNFLEHLKNLAENLSGESAIAWEDETA
jgi:hypothetical protein